MGRLVVCVQQAAGTVVFVALLAALAFKLLLLGCLTGCLPASALCAQCAHAMPP